MSDALEVLDQVIAQNARRAQGNVAAAGKVHVQLHGKQHRGGHEVGLGAIWVELERGPGVPLRLFFR